MEVASFFAGFMVCAAIVSCVAVPALRSVNRLLKGANERLDLSKRNLEAMRRDYDALLIAHLSARQAKNGESA